MIFSTSTQKTLSGKFRRMIALAALSLLAPLAGIAQSHTECGTDAHSEHIHRQYPQAITVREQMDMEVSKSMSARSKDEDTSVYIIPVVFHIIHDNGTENIPLVRLQAQVATLNECYRRKNTDLSLVRTMFKDKAADARIEFRLATEDPWGNCTQGFDRIRSTMTVNATNSVKSLTMWDPSRYLNIWVVRSIEQGGIQGTLAGYAHFPWDAKMAPSLDGIVMNYNFVGKGNKTLAHEVGHYLGLYHTFQGGCVSDQRLQGDKLDDTPPVAEPSFTATATSNTCHTDFPDLPDMWENIMDYNDRKILFTEGQVQRMRSFLRGYRSGLISAENQKQTLANCLATAIENETTAPAGLKADIYPNPAGETIRIQVESASAASMTIDIMDLSGRTIYTVSNIGLTAGNQTVSISAADAGLPKGGMYMVRMQSGDSQVVRKLAL